MKPTYESDRGDMTWHSVDAPCPDHGADEHPWACVCARRHIKDLEARLATANQRGEELRIDAEVLSARLSQAEAKLAPSRLSEAREKVLQAAGPARDAFAALCRRVVDSGEMDILEGIEAKHKGAGKRLNDALDELAAAERAKGRE